MNVRGTARLYLRPLREGAGSGPAPAWRVTEHDHEETEEPCAGAVWDEARWAALEGNWLARIEAPVIQFFGTLAPSLAFVMRDGRITKLPTLLPDGVLLLDDGGLEGDIVKRWESATSAGELLGLLDPDDLNADHRLTRYWTAPGPSCPAIGDLAWRCVWRASIAIAGTVAHEAPSGFVRMTQPQVRRLDAWSRMREAPSSSDTLDAWEAANDLYLSKLAAGNSIQDAAAEARSLASGQCLAAVVDTVVRRQRAKLGEWRDCQTLASAFLADVVREAVGDDLYLSLADASGTVCHE